jgi:hypothetical protein
MVCEPHASCLDAHLLLLPCSILLFFPRSIALLFQPMSLPGPRSAHTLSFIKLLHDSIIDFPGLSLIPSTLSQSRGGAQKPVIGQNTVVKGTGAQALASEWGQEPGSPPSTAVIEPALASALTSRRLSAVTVAVAGGEEEAATVGPYVRMVNGQRGSGRG